MCSDLINEIFLQPINVYTCSCLPDTLVKLKFNRV